MTIFTSIWPSLLLLSVLWTMLAVTFFYVRNQIKKEKKINLNKDVIENNLNERKEFQKEIDDLALYVSRLPRPKDVLKEYRETENNE